MPIIVGAHKLGPDIATLSIRTKKAGAAAVAAHNLLIEVSDWTATLELDEDPSQSKIELTADSASLKVLEGTGGPMKLEADHKAGIKQTIDDEILKQSPIEFRSTEVTPGEDGRYEVTGELELAGKRGLISFELTMGEDGTLSGSAVVKQTQLGNQTVLGAVRDAQGRRRGDGRDRGQSARKLSGPFRKKRPPRAIVMAGAASSSELLSIAGALEQVLGHVAPLELVQVPLEDSYGRFIGRDVAAALDLPPFVSSAMDGFAVRAGDTPGTLAVVGESAAGSPFEGELGAGQAVAISTGAVVPVGADAIVPIEAVELAPGAVIVAVGTETGAFVRYAGSDIERGAPMLAAGTRIGPAQIGAAAAVGLGELPCRRRPRVAILSTGSELVQPGSALGDGEIYDANGPMLRAALRTSGAEVTRIPAAADTREAHRAALEQALEHDVVISSGGVSVGEHDLVRDVGFELGVREVFWRIAMRPGKPLAFGVRDRALLFGLPGNPVSTLVGFELFVRPALLSLQGAHNPRPPFGTGVLASDVKRLAERDDLIRVQVLDGSGRQTVVTPLRGQQSHQIAVTAQADGLALIPRGSGELRGGTEVQYLPLHGF